MKTSNQENEFINSFVRIYQNWRFFIVLLLWSLPVLVNAQTQLGITASVIPINTNHPAAIPTEYSGCFDKFTLRLDISNFLRAATVNSSTPQITLTMPSYVQLSNDNLIYSSGNTINPGSAISLNVAQLSYPHNFNQPTDWNGIWELDFDVNGCGFLNSGNFTLLFSIDVNSQVFDMVAATPLTIPQPCQTVGSIQTCYFGLGLNKPALIFNKNPDVYSSHDEEYYTAFDIVERYYSIQASEGIVDYFKLKIDVEDDIDILKIEAIDPSNVQNPFVIFDDPNGIDFIPGGNSYQILFFDNISQPTQNIVTTGNTYPSSTNFVSVSINDCEFSPNNNNQLFFNGILTTDNTIYIKETVRIRKVYDCNSFISDNTKYELIILCDEILNPIDPLCAKIDETLNLISDYKRALSVYWAPSYLLNGSYLPLGDDYMSVCSSASSALHPYAIDYTALIKNATNNAGGQSLSQGFGTIKLKKLTFNIYSNYFDFNDIVFGNQTSPLNYASIPHYKPDLTLDYTEIIIDFEDAINTALLNSSSNPDPNIANALGNVVDKLNNNYPPTNDRTWLFLPENKEIGITLRGFRLKDCSVLPFANCTEENLRAMGTYILEFYTMCEMKDYISGASQSPLVTTSSDSYSGLNNFLSGYTYSEAKPLDVGPPTPLKSHLKFSYTRNPPSGTLCPSTPKHPWQLENRHICNSQLGDLFHCPNLKYFAEIELPSPASAPGTPSWYTIISNSIIIRDENNLIHTCSLSQVGMTNVWVFECPSLNTAAYTIEFDVQISCGNGYGLDKFDLKFKSSCDDACSDCAATYGCSSISLYSHCFGLCPVNIFVGVHDFTLERTTMGWTDEAAYYQNSGTPNATNVNLEKVYKCDAVKFESYNGYTTSSNAVLNGIDGINKLNFEIQYDERLIPGATNTLISNNGSSFTITPKFYESGSSNIFVLPVVGPWQNGPVGPGNSMSVSLNQNFNYFNVNYNTINITSSGYIQIGTSSPVVTVPVSIPTLGMPSNLVALCWGDLNPTTGTITYADIISGGIIIHFDQVYFNNSLNDYVSGYIILNSNTNEVTIVIDELVNQGNYISAMGIGDVSGKVGFTFKSMGKAQVREFPNASNYYVFNFTPNSLSTCIDSYVVLVNNVNVTANTNTLDPKFGYKYLQFEMDMTYSLPTGCGFNTIRDLLDDYPCRVDFNGAGSINDLNLAPDYYQINAIFGMLTYDRLLSNGSIEHVESCDPYIQNLTYFQTNLVIDKNDLVKHNQTLISLNQCQIAYFLQMHLEGGFAPQSDDFPNEFRPLVVFPDQFIGTTSPSLSISGINFSDYKHLNGNLPTITNYIDNGLGTNTYENNDLAFFPALDKDGNTSRYFLAYLDRDCSTQSTAYDLFFDDFDVLKNHNALFNIASGCSTNFFPSVPFVKSLTISPDDLSNYLDIKFTPQPALSSLKVPTDPIILDFKYSNGTSNAIPDVWVYFSNDNGSGISNPNVGYQLLDIGGNPIPSVSNGGIDYYNLGTISSTSSYKLVIDWTNCLSTSNIYDPLDIKIHYGSICEPITSSTNFPAGCSEVVKTYRILPQSSRISIDNLSPTNGTINGCTDFNVGATYSSLGADLQPNSAIFLVDAPQNLILNLGSSTVTIAGVTHTLSSLNLTIGMFTNLGITNYSFSIYQILDNALGFGIPTENFNLNSPYNTLDFNLNFTPTYSPPIPSNFVIGFRGLANASCGDVLEEIRQTVDFPIINPPTPVQITGNINICSPQTTNLSVPNTYVSYAWSNGQTNSSVTVSAGTFTVTVVDANGCILSHSVIVNDLTPIINITPANVNCAGEPFTLNANAAPCNGCTYLWNTNPQNTTNSISQIATTTTQFNLTVNNQGCIGQSSYLLNVDENCCIIPSYIPLNQSDFNQLFGTSVKVIKSGNYTLGQNVVVNGFVLIEPGTIIKISADKTITIPDGSTLYIEGKSHLSACSNTTWNGIIAEPGSTLEIHSGGVPSAEVTIEDAKIAVNAWMDLAASKLTRIAIDHDVIFNKNNVSLFLHDGNFYNSTFSGINFKCDAPMLAPYQTGNPINAYSQKHVDLRDAGYVNFISPKIGNNPCLYFSDALFGIVSLRTNLTVRNSSFTKGTNPNGFNFRGIYASGNLGAIGTRYKLNVGVDVLTGWPNSLALKSSNIFTDLYSGIAAYKMDVSIAENEFNGGYYPIGIGGCTNGQVFVKYNTLDNFRLEGIRLTDNFNSICLIDYNYLNKKISGSNGGGGFDPLTESRKGIYVNNSIQSYSNLRIHENQIWNTRYGIQMMNQIVGTISKNELHFNIQNSDLVGSVWKRKGIVSQGNTNVYIAENIVTRTCGTCTTDPTMTSSSGNYMLVGIAQDLSDGIIQANVIVNLPTACRINGNCFNTSLQCNYLDNNLEGFRLDDATLMTQGDVDHPTGNYWSNNSVQNGNRIIGSATSIVDWFYDASLSQDYNPQVNTPPIVFNPFTSNTGAFPNCVENNPCIDCIQNRINNLLNDTIYTYHQDENIYLNQQRAFQLLNDSLQLMYSGSIYDVPLQTFFTITALGNIGILEDVREYLVNSDVANALLYNESFSPIELMEINSSIVNEICIDGSLNTDTLVFDDVQRNQLLSIAFQLPIIGGEAVYRARAILHLDVDDTQFSYRVPSNFESANNNFRIYPIPNRGTFTIVNLSDDLVPRNIFVYDISKKLISSINWPENDQEQTIYLKGLEPGVYSVQVNCVNGYNESLKTVIVK